MLILHKKHVINLALSFTLIGLILGILIGISIKYPLEKDSISKLDNLCVVHGGWASSKITITGRIHTVECVDGASWVITADLAKVPVMVPADDKDNLDE